MHTLVSNLSDMVQFLGRTGLGDIDLLPLEDLLCLGERRRLGEMMWLGELGRTFFISLFFSSLEHERGALSPLFSLPGVMGKGFFLLGVDAPSKVAVPLLLARVGTGLVLFFLLRMVP